MNKKGSKTLRISFLRKLNVTKPSHVKNTTTVQLKFLFSKHLWLTKISLFKSQQFSSKEKGGAFFLFLLITLHGNTFLFWKVK